MSRTIIYFLILETGTKIVNKKSDIIGLQQPLAFLRTLTNETGKSSFSYYNLRYNEYGYKINKTDSLPLLNEGKPISRAFDLNDHEKALLLINNCT